VNPTPEARVLQALADHPGGLGLRDLRRAARLKTATFLQALRGLLDGESVVRDTRVVLARDGRHRRVGRYLRASNGAGGVSRASGPVSLAASEVPAVSMTVPPSGQLIQGDVHTTLSAWPSDFVPLAISDPAYGMGKAAWDAVPDYGAWIEEVLRVLAPGGVAYVFGRPEIIAQHWTAFPDPKRWLTWHYTNKTVPDLNFWQPTSEAIVAFSKGKPRFFRDQVREPYSAIYEKIKGRRRAGTPGRFGARSSTYADNGGALPRDVLHCPVLAGRVGARERTEHPTQKPLPLMERLVRSATVEGELVLDLHSGSGTTSVAAHRLGRRWIAVEREPDYCRMATDRLRGAGAEVVEVVGAGGRDG